jgi:ectoine hydroxylase-related dioxygenase (phytanoyl-CoA dioxygenase family)
LLFVQRTQFQTGRFSAPAHDFHAIRAGGFLSFGEQRLYRDVEKREAEDSKMTTPEALDALGATEDQLTDTERAALDRDGYVRLRGVLSAQEVDALRQRMAALLAAEGEDAGKEVHQEGGTARLSDLINKGPEFHIALTQPRVLAAIAHVLQRDMKLSSLNSRNALPGAGLQALHADWGSAVSPDQYQVCNSLWLLDDFLPDNGATRVVPGSQRSGRVPKDDMEDTTQPHPNEVILQAEAGDVVVVNSHTWHGGTINQSGASRRVMHGYFTRTANRQQLDQGRYLTPQTQAQLSEAAQVILLGPLPQ